MRDIKDTMHNIFNKWPVSDSQMHYMDIRQPPLYLDFLPEQASSSIHIVPEA
jgi:hypothetical protein